VCASILINVQILEVLFSYLKFLETQGLCPDFFNEFRWIESLKFHFAEPINPVENSAHVVQNFRDFKAKDCLIGELLPTKWEPEAITSCLKLMTPANANYMMVSKGLSGCEEEELYFETIYGDYSEGMNSHWLISLLQNELACTFIYFY
jgi:secreted Zn-dependent insulinase-like peptidase